jgi:predicted ATPase
MHRISIKNFGPISDAEIEIGDLTIIIGEQATGKSAISKLIYFFQSLKEDVLKSAIYALDHNEDPNKIFKREIQQKFLYYFKPAYFNRDTKIDYYFSKEHYFKVRVSLEENRTNETIDVSATTNYWKNISSVYHEINELLKKPNSKSILQNPITPQSKIKALLDGLFPECYDGLYIPAGRNISVGHSEQFEQYFRDRLIIGLNNSSDLLQADGNRLPTADMFLLEGFMQRVATMKDELREAGGGFNGIIKSYKKMPEYDHQRVQYLEAITKRISEILRGEYRADGSAERIQFPNRKFIWLREASSGQQESIRILQDMMLLSSYGFPVFRAIEEPEAHLFPLAQQHLIELIALAQTATKSRFVLTTHSPYIVSAINNILFSSQLTDSDDTELKMMNPNNIRGYMLVRDSDSGLVKAEFLLKEMGRTGQPLTLMGHTSLDTVSEQMGATFSELRSKYRNLTLNTSSKTGI